MSLKENPCWITYEKICQANGIKTSLSGFRDWLIQNNLQIPSVLKIQIVVYKRDSQIANDGWKTKQAENQMVLQQ